MAACDSFSAILNSRIEYWNYILENVPIGHGLEAKGEIAKIFLEEF